MVKPTNVEELRSWIAEHSGDGMLGGTPVVKPGRTEFRGGFLQGDLYNLLITRSAPFSYTKSDLVQHAFVLLLQYEGDIEKPDVRDARSEYRGYIGAGLHDLVMRHKERLEFNNSELLTVAARLFIANPFVNQQYRQYVEALMDQHKCSEAQVESVIYDWSLLKAREKRLILSTEKGEFVTDTKIAT